MRKIKAEWIAEWFRRTDECVGFWCDNGLRGNVDGLAGR